MMMPARQLDPREIPKGATASSADDDDDDGDGGGDLEIRRAGAEGGGPGSDGYESEYLVTNARRALDYYADLRSWRQNLLARVVLDIGAREGGEYPAPDFTDAALGNGGAEEGYGRGYTGLPFMDSGHQYEVQQSHGGGIPGPQPEMDIDQSYEGAKIVGGGSEEEDGAVKMVGEKPKEG
ncbi:hypothetical protein LZ554_007810 [Drepanopeziza brunnea f. sp. 'monogermtubi']|nr:hypothetical protein LZ554_007810 [Drepanopeziza brunnea f. sp. 'monogermtubi']